MRTKVLIIDDERRIREIEQYVLEADKFEVVATGDPEEGVRIAGAGGIDVIVLDLMMPKLDGFGVLEKLRENEASRTIPVVVVSAVEDQVDKIRSLALGAVEFLGKPFSPKDLRRTVKEALISSGKPV